MDGPVELEHVNYPKYLAKWEIFSEYNRIPALCLHVIGRTDMYARDRKRQFPDGGFRW